MRAKHLLKGLDLSRRAGRPAPKVKSRRTKRMQRDATAVSIVRGRCEVGSFVNRQQLAEGAPLIRMPFRG